MTTGADLPPMDADITRRDIPLSVSSPSTDGGGVPDLPTAAEQVEPSQFTHESKLPPLRLEDPKPRLAKGPTVIALAGLGSAIALATAFAFSPAPPAQKPAGTSDPASVTHGVQLPDVIQDQRTALGPDAAASGQSGSLRRDAGSETHQPNEVAQAQDALRLARREALREETEKALGSSLYANIDDPFAADHGGVAASAGSGGQGSLDATGTARATAPGGTPISTSDQNLQGRQNEFLMQTDRSDGYLANQLVRPRSPYEVKAGTIIPTVLITGINSDLPGTILGQVRENVYDSVSGNYLLIPQGSKVLASYDSMVAYGQERVLVCWQRLIRPDGTSLSLDCQPGVDLGGYAGFADQVDNHWWRVITGIALGSVLAAGVVVPQGNVTGYVPTIGQGMAANAAGAVNQAGQQITSRALNIQPTSKIRPGFSVNVLVTKDMVIPPYRPEGVTR
ncbi:MAG: TrbI/VirB10 family protein [Myxococcales bacterium]